jgi:hypothetical protein
MSEAQRNRILQRGRSLGYTGNNLGQLHNRAEMIRNSTIRGQFTAAQKRTAASIGNSLSGSA